MPKNICHRCRKVVADHDFYIESRGGVVCSSCIIAAENSARRSSKAASKTSMPSRAFIPNEAWADASN